MSTNQPMGLDLGVVYSTWVDAPAAERLVADLPGRRTVKGLTQTRWQLRAIECMDLTTLAGDDTFGRVDRLCAKARSPVRRDILDALAKKLGDGPLHPQVGAVCVYPTMVPEAVECLAGSDIRVASVATGFPDGNVPLSTKLSEIEYAVTEGAHEIDVVITRGYVLDGRWQHLYNEIVAFRKACGSNIHMKVILETTTLGTLENIAKASAVAIMAGADFIKTSTGKAPEGGAKLSHGLVMVREIRRFRDEIKPGHIVGFKPAGGISEPSDALTWLILMMEELGERWTRPDLFRIGASSLLTNLEMQLEHRMTDRYAAAHHQPSA